MEKKDTSAFVDDSAFAEIETSFQEILDSIINDRSLDGFRIEYEKLHDAFQQSHANNQALLGRCRELNEEISANSAKVQAALKFSQNDQRTIAILRGEFEKALRHLETLHTRESRSKSIIMALKAELQNLADLAEKGNLFVNVSVPEPQEEEQTVDAAKEVDIQDGQQDALQAEIERVKKANEVLKLRVDELKKVEKELEEKLATEDDTIEKLACKCRVLSTELEETRSENSSANAYLEKNAGTALDIKNNLENGARDLERRKKEQTETIENTRFVQQRSAATRKELGQIERSIVKVSEERSRVDDIVKERDVRINSMRAELNQLESSVQENEVTFNEVKNLRNQLQEAIHAERKKIGEYRKDITQLSRKLYAGESETKAVQRSVNISQRREELAKQEIHKVEMDSLSEKHRMDSCLVDVCDVKKDLSDGNQRIAQMETEICGYEDEIAGYRTNTLQLEIEKQGYDREISALEQRMIEIEALKQRRISQITEMRSKHDVDTRQFLAYQKESDEIKTELHYLKLSVTQQKDVITQADNECMEIHTRLRRQEAAARNLRIECEQMERELDVFQKENEECEIEVLKRLHLLGQNEIACTTVKNDMKHIADSIMVNNQMIFKRMREISGLREKIRVITDSFRINGVHWTKVNKEIKELEVDLEKVVDKQKVLIRNVQLQDRLRKECFRLEKALLSAQTRLKCLEEESSQPITIHRWRLLESVNPELFELLQMKNILSNKLSVVLAKTQRLATAKSEEEKKLKQETAKLSKRRVSSEYTESVKACAEQIHIKSNRLANVMRESMQKKCDADLWQERVQVVKSEIAHEREQFYITKLKDVAYTTTVREPTITFTGGQSPRSMIPQLRMAGAAAITRPPKSARVYKPVQGSAIFKRPPVLPPLQPIKSARC